MAEVRDGLSGRVVRGWLSRMTPGPWAAEARGSTEVVLTGADGEPVAYVPIPMPHENTAPIAALPEVLRAYLTASGEVLQVEVALAAAGVDEGGVAGVQALTDIIAAGRDTEAELRREYAAQTAQWDRTIGELHDAREHADEAEARVRAVRQLLARWGARELTPEQDDLHRELTGVLMAHHTQPEPAAEPDEEAG